VQKVIFILGILLSLEIILGVRVCLVTAAGAWNSLPSTVTAVSTLHSFRRALKTHLFTASFPPSQSHYLHSVLT